MKETNNLKLQQMLNEYAYIEAQMASLKKAQDELKANLINEFTAQGVTKIDDGMKSVTMSNRQTVKVKDETKVITFLKENGMANLVKETIKTTDFNKMVKMNTMLLEGVQNDYEVVNTTVLTYKQK